MPDGRAFRIPVQPFLEKYFASVFQKYMFISAHPVSPGGALRPIATDVGSRMRWTHGYREASVTDADGEIVWSRSPDAGIKFRETSVSLDDGGYQSPDTGEITYKPINHRAGNAGLFRRTCGDLLACTFHFARKAAGAIEHPAFPAPSD